MTNSELCFDAWAVRKLATDNFSTEHWDNVDSINYLKLRAAIIAVMSSVNILLLGYNLFLIIYIG